uniref:Alcohol dehydrogenase transcription factor n=1 Tax=Musca domestica TaxID=7370 RepID=T1PJA5_MUSDO
MYNKGNSNSSSSATTTATSTTNANAATSSSAGNNNSSSAGPNDRIEWSRATILGFIEDYRRQRVLWDPNTKGYHIKQTKYEALKALGQKYGAEIRSIRSKIKSLRSSFHREHGKVINGRRKGLNYQPMWFAYDAIRFILDGETGDSDEADGVPKNDNLDSTSESNLNNNNSLTNNNNNNSSINSLMGWSGHATDEEPLLEERKISSRDIEHFNNHFLALGLQARHPMAMLAAVEAAAAASVLSAAVQEKRQEQDYALLKQQQQQLLLQQQHKHKSDNDDDNSENGHRHDSSSSPSPLKIIELSTISSNNNNNDSVGNVNIMSSSTNTTANTSSSNTASATLNPISKPFASPKPSSPLAGAPTATTTTTKSTSATAITPPPQTLQPPAQSQQQQLPHHQPSSTSTSSVTATAATTCSPENYNVLHGSRSLDENSAIAIGNNAAATAISSLPITAVTRTSDFDGSEYCNISAEDVKTEIFESDSTELAMLESARTSTPVPLNYHKHATDLTVQRNGNSLGGVGGSTGSSRKRKAQMHSNANHIMDADAPSPSKLLQQHSNAIHSRQCDYLNSSINGGAGFSANNNNNNNHHAASNSSGTSNPLASGSKPSSTPIDEYGVFGEYVAITIRKLKTSKAKIVVKHLINNLLYEAELGKYDQGIPASKEPPELYKM